MTLNSSWYNPERKVWESLHLDLPPVLTTLGSPTLGQSAFDQVEQRFPGTTRDRGEVTDVPKKIIRSRRVRPMTTSIGFPPGVPRAVENGSFTITSSSL